MTIPKLTTDAIQLLVLDGVPLTIKHGLGRQIEGWLVIWKTAHVNFKISDPDADTRQTLVLVPDADATVKIVLL